MSIDNDTFQKIKTLKDIPADQITVENLLPLLRGLNETLHNTLNILSKGWSRAQ